MMTNDSNAPRRASDYGVTRSDMADTRALYRRIRTIRRGGSMPIADTGMSAARVRALLGRYAELFETLGTIATEASHYAVSHGNAFGHQSMVRGGRFPATITRS